jgi:hypothetical protein
LLTDTQKAIAAFSSAFAHHVRVKHPGFTPN